MGDMTVAELISVLQSFDDNTIVIMDTGDPGSTFTVDAVAEINGFCVLGSIDD